MIDTLLILLILINLLMLGASRLATFIELTALQGLILGGLTLAIHQGDLTPRIFILGFGSALLKGVCFPWLFLHILKSTPIKREIEPLIGYSWCVFIGALFFGFSWWIAKALPMGQGVSDLVLPISFFTIFSGAFLMVSRSKAITQVIGYLVMENGIYLLGMSLMGNTELMVEMGVLLDVTVAIFIMQMLIHHIRKEFESMNINRLTQLKDWETG